MQNRIALDQLEKEKTALQEKLNHLKKTKFKFLIKPILIYPIATLVIPFIPLRGKGQNLVSIMGTEKSILFIGSIFSAVLIWGLIVKRNEYKAELFDVETEIELINSRIAKLKE
ncbi:hypothetical protein [Flavobacterium terrisoli]|uniref:hypothetical protein n=1 Tax=Flavobacterium terrisoli TaxID=3242195 RepID=UPI002543C69A|nr:hypothetical protein [Flavobacterium buctense]